MSIGVHLSYTVQWKTSARKCLYWWDIKILRRKLLWAYLAEACAWHASPPILNFHRETFTKNIKSMKFVKGFPLTFATICSISY